MLNGKFFTGLPPKMMERNSGAPNRLESHLFWPDDSKAEPVQKRRSSLQTELPGNRDGSFQRQSSLGNGASEVDTKQRFKKEFTNSSIQFYDNIQEEEMGSRRQAIRKPLIRQAMKQDIAIKPTAMNMKLPNGNVVAQEESATIKKNQAFNSKIQFYDYADGNGNERQKQNNQLKPKMDMNDKKDVERNTKNSPKLQVKGIVRNLRVMDEQRNNDRNERDRKSYENEEEYEKPRQSTRFIRNEVRGEQRNDNIQFGGRSNNQRNNNRPTRTDRHRDTIDEGHDIGYDDDVTNLYDIRKPFNTERDGRRVQNAPKKILKNTIQDEEDFNELDYVERGTQNMRIRSSPKKHVTYDEEVYERNEHNGAFNYDDGISYSDNRINQRENMEFHSQKGMTSRNYSTNGNNQPISLQQQKGRQKISDYDETVVINDEERFGNDRMQSNYASKKSLNLNKSNNNNHNQNQNNNRDDLKLNNLSQHKQQRQRYQQREITPKISNSPMASASDHINLTSTSMLSPTTTDIQKHLRSSLCFSDGEIVGNVESTPTSDPSSRRTARSAATTRRVCVGLPD